MKRAHRSPSHSAYRLLGVLVLAALAAVLSVSCGSGSSGGGGSNGGGGPAVIERGPQLAQLTDTSIVIAWRTSATATGAVDYGTTMAFGATAPSAGPGEEHVVRLEGLLPDSTYFYHVLVDGTAEAEIPTFRTAPADPNAPFRFAAFADCGAGNARQLEVAARVLESNPLFAVLPGDIVYESGATGELDPKYFRPYVDVIDRIPFYPALGNHDVRTRNGQPLLDALYLPVNDQDGTERYFSFDCANTHLVALDSNSPTELGSPQWTWLDGDLGASAAQWKVVYFHHPPYSSSHHGSDLQIRGSLGPLFDKHHVDLVLCGHDHDYERTFPLLAEQVVDANQEPSYTDPRGTVYVVTGGGGRSLYPAGTSFFTAKSQSIHHFTQVDVSGPTIHLRAIAFDGTLIDEAQITKSGGP